MVAYYLIILLSYHSSIIRLRIIKMVKTTAQFVSEAKIIHGDNYGYDETIYVKSSEKLKIFCYKCNQYFWQSPNHHLKGSRCGFCYQKKKSNTIDFITKSHQIHGEDYDYKDVVYVNCSTEVKIWCKKCQKIFVQKPNSHLNGQGCRTCGHEKSGASGRKSKEQFILDSKRIHMERYSYDKVVYINSKIKIEILCNVCKHTLFQTPNSHLKKGEHCTKCKGKITNTEDFLLKAVAIHREKYNYDKTQYVDAKTKITILCNLCKHVFVQLPSKHLSGQGCTPCSIIRRSDIRRSNLAFFIAKAQVVHGNTYNYTNSQYISSNKKLEMCCNTCQLVFSQTPGNHLSGAGCPECSIRNNAKSRTLSTEEFIRRAVLIHRETYGYERVIYINGKEKVEIWCTKCCSYIWQVASSHISGHGCDSCYGQKLLTTEEFCSRATLVHSEKYTYNDSIYKGMNINIKIWCLKCRKFFIQNPSNHLNGAGCKSCGVVSISDKNRSTKQEFVRKAEKIHNNRYTYEKVVYFNVNTKVQIKCLKCKNYYWQKPMNHLAGCGCSICINKTESILLEFLKIYGEIKHQYIPQWFINPVTLKSYIYDFYFVYKSKNIIIELDGPQHFKQVSNWRDPLFTSADDVHKMQIAFSHNHYVIRLLQEDVFHNKNNWEESLTKAIKEIGLQEPIMYLATTNIYDLHKEWMSYEKD